MLPLAITLVVAYASRSATFALITGCLTGIILYGRDPAGGFVDLASEALGNSEFIWITIIIIAIGILFEFYKYTGVFRSFTRKLASSFSSERGTGFSAWLMGLFIIDDYFSPLMSGMVMRPLTDRLRISREKLAFILDSTTAPACVLFPFTAWGAYLAGLTADQGGAAADPSIAFSVFLNSIPYNFYAIILIIFTLGIALKIIPDFGPMRKAEKRARTTGAVIRPGASPLISEEADGVAGEGEVKANLITDMVVPLAIIIGVAATTLIVQGSVKIAEAFITSVAYLSVLMFVTRRMNGITGLINLFYRGMKSVIPALVIIALAYCLNTITRDLGSAAYITGLADGLLTPSLLVAATFFFTSVISFSTGTSWGAFAIMMPFSLSVAYTFTGGEIEPLIYKCVAAVAGGGIFGDHSSPVSDTSVLSSAGAGCDHMDHVITQLPYAILVGVATIIIYLVV